MYFCETGGFAAVYSYGMMDRQLFMRRRRINILLRRGATLTEGIDRMKTYKTIMNGLTKVEEFVLCVITVVVTAITFINVLSRYVFHSNFAWSEELVINVFILMIMLGCALCTRDGSMITLSLIFDTVGVGGKKILTVIDTVVNLIFYGILIYTGFDKVAGQISTGKETFSLGWPEWVFTILLPIGSIFLVLHAIEYLVDVLGNNAACVKPAETEGGKETV